ncbi:MAG: hypothetical protein V1660_00360 [archaeon]
MKKKKESIKEKKQEKKQGFKAKREIIVSLILLSLFFFSFWYFSNDLVQNFPSLELIKENAFNFGLSFAIVFIGLLLFYSIIYFVLTRMKNAFNTSDKRKGTKLKSKA